MVGNRLKLLRLSLSVAVMLFGLAVVAAPSGAQTIPPDYTPVQHSDGPPETPPEVPPGSSPPMWQATRPCRRAPGRPGG